MKASDFKTLVETLFFNDLLINLHFEKTLNVYL